MECNLPSMSDDLASTSLRAACSSVSKRRVSSSACSALSLCLPVSSCCATSFAPSSCCVRSSSFFTSAMSASLAASSVCFSWTCASRASSSTSLSASAASIAESCSTISACRFSASCRPGDSRICPFILAAFSAVAGSRSPSIMADMVRVIFKTSRMAPSFTPLFGPSGVFSIAAASIPTPAPGRSLPRAPLAPPTRRKSTIAGV
mmetsp:Transcript_73960/g.211180  ORF Transcript_73960/g.211180 Transcript_73960/m.211180 type:complete len:205 (-) Transcript_73960:1231-1845(-)